MIVLLIVIDKKNINLKIIAMKDNSKILAALLAGLAAGAAIGILFAPERGAETRDKLSDSLKNLGDSIKDRAADEIENLSSFKNKVVDNIKSKLRTAEDEYISTSPKNTFKGATDKAEGNINKVTNS